MEIEDKVTALRLRNAAEGFGAIVRTCWNQFEPLKHSSYSCHCCSRARCKLRNDVRATVHRNRAADCDEMTVSESQLRREEEDEERVCVTGRAAHQVKDRSQCSLFLRGHL